MFRETSRRLGLRSLATATLPKTTDILIVGGGPAGLTLAAAIKTSPTLSHLSTTLVEAGDLSNISNFYDNPPEDYHNRIINLNPQSKSFLTKTVGVKLLESRAQSFDGLVVTDGCSNGLLQMERDNMGHMIEIYNIQSSILKYISKLNPKNLEIIDKAKVAALTNSTPNDPTSWPIVKLDNGTSLKARLLVGADGKNSPVRKFSKIESRGWPYHKWGIVANLKLEYPPYILRGWQRFLPTGPIAHLPMPGDNAALTWSTTEKLAKLLIAIDPDAFVALVNAAFILDDADMRYYYNELENATISTKELIEDVEYRTQLVFDRLKHEELIDELYPPKVTYVRPSSRARFPLAMAHADTYVADRVALVGDAAHTTHPLAGQGLNMGQGDVESLVKTLEKALHRGLDIGSFHALEGYWAERYPINNVLLGGVDKLQKLYSTDSAPIVALRTLGINFINQLGPLKNFMMSKVSGSDN